MSKDAHLPGYQRPKTREPRRTRQPFAIDKLPADVRENICKLRNQGKTWREIQELSPEFAGQRLAETTLHRWYDVRVAQSAPLPRDLEHLATLIADRVIAQLKDLLTRRAA